MTNYDFKGIEKKWQHYWNVNRCHEPDMAQSENKFYNLTMFSYPSGDRLHVGHWYNFAPADTFARYKKMCGYNVFQPQGFDAFGLPAENYAIKHGIHPAISTRQNISRMKEQLIEMGAMFDWRNEINTSSPEYYKWTQWLFLKLMEMGLAYQKKSPVNWCPSCSTVLANEQVNNGECDRCHSQVTKRLLKQWFFKITEYAEELLTCLDSLNWPEKTKHMQRNWIGKSIGSSIQFSVVGHSEVIDVFTTRSDTIFGATYMVLAPEHPFVNSITTTNCLSKVTEYVENTKKLSEIDRTSSDRDKSGVFTGAYATNPLTQQAIPIWISDYVVASYGTGAIMAVPSGDERDFQFATKFNLPIIEVVSADGEIHGNDQCFSDYGIVVNSGKYNGMTSEAAKISVDDFLESKDIGGAKVQYKLHDWLISRQRYWGAPIPIIHCDDCGIVPVPFDQIPVLLPDDINLAETYGQDISPLATHDNFINANCPVCNKPAKRDADTMDTFVCSSWYYLRYPDSHFDDGPFNPDKTAWLPIDQYIGGAEHATMHLLYARFITKALRDGGYLNFDEPFSNLFHQGTITRDGAKMSKSKGNTVSPDTYIEKCGADVFRSYLMFMGPFDEGGDWTDTGIVGIERFIQKSWKLCQKELNSSESAKDLYILHTTIKSVTTDLESKKFNTALSRLMEFVNYFIAKNTISKNIRDQFVQLLAPFMPHAAEELWEMFGNKNSIFNSNWPKCNEQFTVESMIEIAIQVNGKLLGSIEIDKNISKEALLQRVKELENIQKFISGKEIVKEIFVPGRLVNIVIK